MVSTVESNVKEYELQLKRHEIETKSWELYNNYVQDLRSRIDGIVRAVLVVSGGALTVSAGIFLRLDRPEISPELIPVLQYGWIALGISMILMIALVVHIIIVGSLHADRWHEMLENRTKTLKQPGRIPKFIGWTIGLSGIVCCFTGIGLLVYIAKAIL